MKYLAVKVFGGGFLGAMLAEMLCLMFNSTYYAGIAWRVAVIMMMPLLISVVLMSYAEARKNGDR